MGTGRWKQCIGAVLVTATAMALLAPSAGASRTRAAGQKPTGEPITIGIVNSEGAPGLDFPEFTDGFDGGAAFVNKELNGFGGRPVKLEECIVKGTPESSQQCAQQLVEAQVDMVVVGLDVYTDFKTFEAAGIPVVGTIPILPGDYTQKAVFTTGGNLSVMPPIVKVAKETLGAKKVGIVSTDNAAGNVGLALLESSLDKAGIAYTTVKGGDNETDAGYQGLVRQATADDPDALISLYSEAGCVGTIRARAALGLDVPALAISTCARQDVLDAAGEDAAGWYFAGSSDPESEQVQTVAKYVGKVTDTSPKKVNTGGFTVIGFTALATLAESAADAAKAGEVTGQSVYDTYSTAKGKKTWGAGQAYECGQVPEYPAVCAFAVPFTKVLPGGKQKLLNGGKPIDGIDYLP